MTKNVRSEEGPLHSELGDVPSGSVADLEAWVGDDRSRAALALTVENDREGGARSTLVDYLNRVLDIRPENDLASETEQG